MAMHTRGGGEVERTDQLVRDAERYGQGQRAARVLHCPHAVGEVHRAGLARSHVDAVGRPVDPLVELALAVVPHLAVDDGVLGAAGSGGVIETYQLKTRRPRRLRPRSSR